MKLSAVTLSLIVPTAALAANARQPTPSPAISASVDANGRVTPMARDSENLAPASSALPSSSAALACPRTSPLSKDAARALVLSVATQENFFPDFVVAVAEVASRFDATAISPRGAYGLMQLDLETAKRFSVDLCDPTANVLGGVRYLRYLHDRYRNPMFILSAYYAGEAAMLSYRGVPPFAETVRFVADVLNAFYVWPDPKIAAATKPGPNAPNPASGAIIESFGDAPAPSNSRGDEGPDAEIRHWD